jgi:hypothetical protein
MDLAICATAQPTAAAASTAAARAFREGLDGVGVAGRQQRGADTLDGCAAHAGSPNGCGATRFVGRMQPQRV